MEPGQSGIRIVRDISLLSRFPILHLLLLLQCQHLVHNRDDADRSDDLGRGAQFPLRRCPANNPHEIVSGGSRLSSHHGCSRSLLFHPGLSYRCGDIINLTFISQFNPIKSIKIGRIEKLRIA